jgi:hypothetical protein
MRLETKIAPPYSAIFVMDPSHGKVPKSFDGHLISATPSCIAIGTLSEMDGQTTVILTNENSESSADTVLVFDNFLDTPNRQIAVCTALNQCLLTLNVSGDRCRVQIRVNDEKEPSQIEIVGHMNVVD